MKLLQQYPVVRSADYVPEVGHAERTRFLTRPQDMYGEAPAEAPAPIKAAPQREVNSDQARAPPNPAHCIALAHFRGPELLEQALREFTIEEKASTAGKDFFTELTALAQRYMTPQDTERFIRAFRAEHDAFVASLKPLEARKLREDLASHGRK